MSLRDLYQQYASDPDLLDRTADEALKIYENSEVKAMRFQSETYRHWGQLAAIAANDADKTKDHVKEVVWSDCYLRAAKRLEEEEGKKPSEKRIEASARRDPYYQRELALLREAELRAEQFKTIEKAFWHRKEMLEQINFRQCRELSH
jgi:hypothetical protein